MAPTVRRLLQPDPDGSLIIRSLISFVQGGGTDAAADQAALHCKSQPHIEKFFRMGGFDRLTKTAVAAGTTTGSHYLDDMAPIIARDLFLLLQSASLFGRLAPRCRRGEFRTKQPREVGAGAGGSWRGEGFPTPAMRTTTDSFEMDVFEAVCAFVVTREVFRFGLAEATLRAIISAAVSKFIDQQLLDPSVTATSAHPAAITNGAATVASTGSSAAQILADLASLVALPTSPGDDLVLVGPSLSFAYINAKLASVGYPTTPGFLIGLPVIAGSTSPHQIALIDCSSIAVAFDEGMTIDVNTTGSIEMDSAPGQSAVSGTGRAMVSLFQTQSVALKCSLNCAWQSASLNAGSPTQPSGVAVLTGITY
jgi:hypothetical protein